MNFVLEFFYAFEVLCGEYHPFETHFDAFVDALFGKRHAAHLAREADFSENGGIFVDRFVFISACKRRAYGKVDGGFGKANAAHGVEVNVLIVKGKPAPLFEHGDEENQLIIIDAQRHAAGQAVGSFCEQGLNFHHHAAVARFGRGDAAARRLTAAFGQEDARIVGNAVNAFARHLEYAHLLH